MGKITVSLSLVTLLAMAMAPTPATAGNVPLYGVPVDFHFSDASGRDHVLRVSVDVDDVNNCMGSYASPMVATELARQRDPKLAGMTFTHAVCHGGQGPKDSALMPPPPPPPVRPGSIRSLVE